MSGGLWIIRHYPWSPTEVFVRPAWEIVWRRPGRRAVPAASGGKSGPRFAKARPNPNGLLLSGSLSNVRYPADSNLEFRVNGLCDGERQPLQQRGDSLCVLRQKCQLVSDLGFGNGKGMRRRLLPSSRWCGTISVFGVADRVWRKCCRKRKKSSKRSRRMWDSTAVGGAWFGR